MKAYVCDSCGKTILDPYTENMRVFYIGSYYDFGMTYPGNSKKKVKVHLCKNCYKGLCSIAEEMVGETDD